MSRITIKSLQEKIEKVSSEKLDIENTLESERNQHKEEIETLKSGHAADKEQLEQRISELENDSKEKQKQSDIRELKELASAYAEQEEEYEKDTEKWLKYVVISFVALAISVLVSINLGKGLIWYGKLESYSINFVVVTFLVFALKQYSYFNRLRTDYANRKTLAQSYHNILGSEEDIEIRSRFLERATDVLCAQSEIADEANTIPEKLLESLTEIAKNLSKNR